VKGYSFSTPAVAGLDLAVNGPKDERLEWDAIDWRIHESTVVRLRRRTLKATREGYPTRKRPRGLPEPRVRGKPARPVLRGSGAATRRSYPTDSQLDTGDTETP
jgi:hypothetical protein